MGYSTDFNGGFKFSKPLTKEQKNYLIAFNGTRRMKRNSAKLAFIKDELREAVNLPIGEEGAFFVAGKGFGGQDRDDTILDYNETPGSIPYDLTNFSEGYALNEKLGREAKRQPSLWCQWTANEDGTELIWDGSEKFYSYVSWLNYLIVHIFNKWDIKLNGLIFWKGEEENDNGSITIMDNVITVVNFTDEEFTPFSPFEPREVYE